MAKTFKLIKGVENTPLKKLNEGQALKNPDKYVFQGVFTACSTPEHKIINRNGRVYMRTEMLRHLGYLRDMIKENNGRILGELDHPEGRFDVSMKEASHMITDLWFDEKTNCVMGRLEVLDTPNGKTLKQLIDAGFPLYVSSRAAGDVNERTKEVEIAQIFTYDVVCTPGFKEARLERVNESVLSDKALKYINESISSSKKIEVDLINVPKSQVNEAAVAAYNKISIKDVMKPLNEDEETKDVEKKDVEKDDKEKTDKPEENALNDVQDFFPTMDGNDSQVNEDGEDESEEEKEEKEEADENKDDSSEENSDDSDGSEDDDDDEEKEELSDEEKEENRKLIISIMGYDKDGEPMTDEDDSEDKGDDIIDIEAIGDDAESNDDSDNEDNGDSEENAEEETSEAEESDEAAEYKEKQKKIKKETDDNIAELESILDSVQKAESVKESIIRRYPFTISLSESNFAKFASLRPKLKKRCADFIEEHEIFDIKAINELWATPLREDKKMQQNWLKLASQSDIDLYVAAPVDVQNAIEESAKYVVLETAEDVDLFWQRTGLRQANAQRIMNEQRIENYRQNITETPEQNNINELGYSMDFIKMTESYFNM